MDFDSLENLWAKQTVTRASDPAAPVIARLKTEVRSAQRRFRGAIVIAASLLILEWAAALAAHVTSLKPLTPVSLVGHVVGSILYVALLLRAIHSARLARQEIAQMGETPPASLAATLRTVELQIQNTRIAAYAIPLVVALSAGLFLAKYLAGDIPGFGAVAGSSFMTALGLAIGVAFWRRHRTQLAPRRAELRALLADLDSNESDPPRPR